MKKITSETFGHLALAAAITFMAIRLGPPLFAKVSAKQVTPTVMVGPMIHPKIPGIVSAPYKLGRTDAPRVILEFADTECPYCGLAHEKIEPFIVTLVQQGSVLFVPMDFPLDIHKSAKRSAYAQRCAGEQGKYWALRHALYTNQDSLNFTGLDIMADGLGLDRRTLNACIMSEKYADAVKADMAKGYGIDVKSTPSFLVGKRNGEQVDGWLIPGMDLATLKKYLEL